jgi:hypothetical protein
VAIGYLLTVHAFGVPQRNEKGSSGMTRTYNPPVNSYPTGLE